MNSFSDLIPYIITGLFSLFASVIGVGGGTKWFLDNRAKKLEEKEVYKASIEKAQFKELFSELLKEKIEPLFKKEFDAVYEQMDEIKKSFEYHKAEGEKSKMRELRKDICQFASEISLERKKPSKEYFDEMLLCTDEYEKFCEDNPDFKNSLANESIELIREEHKKYMQERRK